MANTRRSAEELAKLGIHVEVEPVQVLGDDPPVVEPMPADELGDAAAWEKFLNERVQIRVATTTDPNAPPRVVLTVNDVNNRVVVERGKPTWVKRLHVEVLARMRETRYTQPARNMADPESGNYLIPAHAMVYPFEVLSDPSPRGREWLERILAEPS